MSKEEQKQALFQLFNEIGIINQLSTTMFNRRLPDGMHVSHFSVINHLCRLGDGCTPLQLANAFQVTKATMTNTITKLSSGGYIELVANPEDGRSKLVYLTDKGRAFRAEAIQTLDDVLERLAQDLDVSKLMTIIPELETLRLYMDQNRDE